MNVYLAPMARECMHELFRGFKYDPDIFLGMDQYEKLKDNGRLDRV